MDEAHNFGSPGCFSRCPVRSPRSSFYNFE